MRRVAAAVLMMSLGACKRDEPPPQQDATLSKLREEVDRVNAGGSVVNSPAEPEDPNANLAALATGQAAGRGMEGPLVLPAEGVSATAGTLTVKVLNAATSHQLQSPKMTLTTEDLFLKVVIATRNEGSAPVPFTIEKARIVAGEESWPIARDAHFLVGTRQVGFDAQPGETKELTLVFEVPPSAAKAEGLALTLPQPSGGNGDVRLRLK